MRHAQLLTAAAVLSVCGISFASNVVVTPSNLNGWAFNSADSDGNFNSDPNHIGAFVEGPATPPLGTGSAELKIINGAGDGAEQLRNSNYAGTPLSSVTSLGFSTYDVTNNGQQFPYLALAISTTGGTVADDALFFEPPYQTPSTGNPSLPNQGATQMNAWQSWDAKNGGWWNNLGDLNPGTGVGSLADYLALYPSATIVNGATYGGVRLGVGYSSMGDNYEGYVDAFTIGVNGVETTYDFESTPEPASLGLIGLAGVALLRRRRR